MKLNVEVAYVVGDNKNKKNSSSDLALAFPVSEVVKCGSCEWSKISIARSDGFNTIYDHASPLFNVSTGLESLVNEDFWKTLDVKFERSSLTSNRYVSDFSFSKDATFFHNLKNSED